MSHSKISDSDEPFPDSGSEYVLEEESMSSSENNTQTKFMKKNEGIKKISSFFVINKGTSQSKRDKIATCTLCKTKKTTLKMKNGATSSLKRHLQSKHKRTYDEYFPQENEKTTEVNSSSISVLSFLGQKSKTDCDTACATLSVSLS